MEETWKELAPQIHRQRLIIEGCPLEAIVDNQIKEYLFRLSTVLGMTTVLEPVTHCSEKFGWAGWIHWETSGAHFYAWEQPLLFFSVDIYTCKAFDDEKAVEFTKAFFGIDSVVFKAV